MGKGKAIAGVLAIGIIGTLAAACVADKSKNKDKFDNDCSGGEKEQVARGKTTSDQEILGQAVRTETP